MLFSVVVVLQMTSYQATHLASIIAVWLETFPTCGNESDKNTNLDKSHLLSQHIAGQNVRVQIWPNASQPAVLLFNKFSRTLEFCLLSLT